MGMDEYSNASGRMPGYVTCQSLKEVVCSSNAGAASASSNNNSGGGGQQQQRGNQSGNPYGTSPNGVPMDPIMNVCKRIYASSQKTLTNCAFIKDLFGFQRCIRSLMQEYDLRRFFGGMRCYHDCEAMVRVLGIPSPERFSSQFQEETPDQLMLPTRLSGMNNTTEFCIGLRFADAFLFMAAMGRPRRDVGILADFAKTLAEYSMQVRLFQILHFVFENLPRYWQNTPCRCNFFRFCIFKNCTNYLKTCLFTQHAQQKTLQVLPRSIFPYSMVPMTRLDPVEKKQVLMLFQGVEEEGDCYVPRPLVITRHNNPSILGRNFALACAGKVCAKVLEDEMYMSELIELSETLSLDWRSLPIDMLPALNVHWEYGVCYPVARYLKAEAQPQENLNIDDNEDDPDRASSDELEIVMQQVAERLSNADCGALFLHPTRYSMMLWVMDSQSRCACTTQRYMFSH